MRFLVCWLLAGALFLTTRSAVHSSVHNWRLWREYRDKPVLIASRANLRQATAEPWGLDQQWPTPSQARRKSEPELAALQALARDRAERAAHRRRAVDAALTMGWAFLGGWTVRSCYRIVTTIAASKPPEALSWQSFAALVFVMATMALRMRRPNHTRWDDATEIYGSLPRRRVPGSHRASGRPQNHRIAPRTHSRR